MFKRLLRLLLGIAAGTAAVYYFTSDRGRRTLDRAAARVKDSGLDIEAIMPTIRGVGHVNGQNGDQDGSIEAKIAETRRRLRERLQQVQNDAGGPADPNR